ncbi:MAG: hypothetical protein GVY14_12525 [Spirochaetes bacterium]|jgi:hypothetical protein|nr:hypothetical protein [Spirochaetota bacterium]
MDFWERFRMTVDKGVESSRGVLGKAQERARGLGEKGVLRFEIMQLESRAEKITTKLGARTFEVLVKEEQNTVSKKTPGVRELIEELSEIETRVKEKEEALERIGQAES